MNTKQEEVTYDEEENMIEIKAGGAPARTVGPETARKIASDLEDNHAEEMVDEESDLAKLVADLEMFADRAENAQQDQ